jgi:hypothetical protein
MVSPSNRKGLIHEAIDRHPFNARLFAAQRRFV